MSSTNGISLRSSTQNNLRVTVGTRLYLDYLNVTYEELPEPPQGFAYTYIDKMRVVQISGRFDQAEAHESDSRLKVWLHEHFQLTY